MKKGNEQYTVKIVHAQGEGNAYRIFLLEDKQEYTKVLDIVRNDKAIVAGCAVSVYEPMDDVSQT